MCSIAGCDRPAKGRTWCPEPYNNWYRRGDPLLGPRPKRFPDRKQPLFDRFWSKVDFSTPDGCWEWRGSIRHELGYGEVWVQGKRQYAHRTAYEIVYGDIPGVTSSGTDATILDVFARSISSPAPRRRICKMPESADERPNRPSIAVKATI